jgi:hypothetical protein
LTYEYAYKDGRINVSSMVNDLEIPTIGVINGSGFHTEMLDLHYDIGSVPERLAVKERRIVEARAQFAAHISRIHRRASDPEPAAGHVGSL